VERAVGDQASQLQGLELAASLHEELAAVARAQGRWRECRAELERTLVALSRLSTQRNDDLVLRRRLVDRRFELAVVGDKTGETAEALAQLEQADWMARELSKQEPTNLEYRRMLIRCSLIRAELLAELGRLTNAGETAGQALEMVVKANPADRSGRVIGANHLALMNLSGSLALAQADPARARALRGGAVMRAEELVGKHPDDRAIVVAAARAFFLAGVQDFLDGKEDGAKARLERAGALIEGMLKEAPANQDLLLEQAGVLAGQGKLGEALAITARLVTGEGAERGALVLHLELLLLEGKAGEVLAFAPRVLELMKGSRPRWILSKTWQALALARGGDRPGAAAAAGEAAAAAEEFGSGITLQTWSPVPLTRAWRADPNAWGAEARPVVEALARWVRGGAAADVARVLRTFAAKLGARPRAGKR